MLLCLDIGNSLTKVGLFDGDALVRTGELSNLKMDASDFCGFSFSSVVLSSVVPKATEMALRLFADSFGIMPLVISSMINTGLDIKYNPPESLGADRICASAGALGHFLLQNKEYSKKDAIITVDLGTANTVDIVIFPRIFLGGSISPGLRLMASSLGKKTALLPEANIKPGIDIWGKDTDSAISAGILNATAGLIERTVAGIKSQGYSTHTYITGGLAGLIMPLLNMDHIFRPHLVIEGMRRIFEMNDSP